jgi:5'(3')-deoxyribonucleotidase
MPRYSSVLLRAVNDNWLLIINFCGAETLVKAEQTIDGDVVDINFCGAETLVKAERRIDGVVVDINFWVDVTLSICPVSIL